MGIYKKFASMVQFVLESVIRLFSASDDDYPKSGVQPFNGEPPHKNKKADW